MKKELKQDLKSINFDKYIEIFEREGLNDFSDLKNLTEEDYEKIGVSALGDRKKLVKLYSCQEMMLSINQSENNSENKSAQQQIPQPTPVIVNNAEGSSHNGWATGLAGVIGGILGALAVIVLILVILSNESWAL
ncbi:MAG: SAM domain-containing protein [Ruminococcus flavefaciens]|nr:SAM domain-containing protein [Ruminococcus flavefaciens]